MDKDQIMKDNRSFIDAKLAIGSIVRLTNDTDPSNTRLFIFNWVL